MRRIATSGLAAIAALLLVAFAAFVSYDMRVFQPRQAQIQALLQRAPAEERVPPALIRRYILATYATGASPSSSVARMLLGRLEVTREQSMLGWHTHEVLWDLLVRLHLSQDEILGLYATLSYNGAGYGLSQLSQRLYAKPLSALSEPEAATVVAVLWWPQAYLRDRARLERRRDLLMARAREAR
ncbi:transglycosylase domain-containing protein [Xanthomonas medicagonis]|uniref:transglycosylase domain-containing protein n=1 Tax=Xanthomonas medicagonis TaxID=3160841 RepID=UPI003511CD89